MTLKAKDKVEIIDQLERHELQRSNTGTVVAVRERKSTDDDIIVRLDSGELKGFKQQFVVKTA